MTWAFVLYSFKPLPYGNPMTFMVSGTKNDMLNFPDVLKNHLHTFYDYVYYVECHRCVCPVYFAGDEPSEEARVVYLGEKNKLDWGVQLREELKKLREVV